MRAFVYACALALAACAFDPGGVGSGGEEDAGPLGDGSAADRDTAAGVIDASVSDALTNDAVLVEPDASFALRLNVAGPSHMGIDFPGAWSSDPGSGGVCNGSEDSNEPHAVFGTQDDPLFRTMMFGQTVTCSVTVPNGTYNVRLLWGEIWLGGGTCENGGSGRTMDVVMEGVTTHNNVDVYNEGNGCIFNAGGQPVQRTGTTTVSDGVLDIQLVTRISNNAYVSAIEIVAAP